jgi:hypothetical protein
VLQLLVIANVVPSSLDIFTAIRSFETSVLTRATRRYIPEDAILRANSVPTYTLDLKGHCFVEILISLLESIALKIVSRSMMLIIASVICEYG